MIIENLSNEDYHNRELYPQLSSSQVKKILDSPFDFKNGLENKSESTPYMIAGSAFHDYNEAILKTGFDWDFLSNWNVFEHPLNPKSGEPVGITTKAYLTAKGESQNSISNFQLEKLQLMQKSFEKHPATRVIFYENVEFERSFFVTDNEVEQKIRPDRETEKYIIDLKTCRKGESSIHNVNRLIEDRGYDVSAAMYQWLYYIETGIWKPFLWIFVENEYPYQVNYHWANDYAYNVRKKHNGGIDVIANISAVKYKAAISTYKKCLNKGKWGGSEVFINNPLRIGSPKPNNWNKIKEFYI